MGVLCLKATERGCDQLGDTRAFGGGLGRGASGPLLVRHLVIQSKVPLWADGPVAWQVGRMDQPSLTHLCWVPLCRAVCPARASGPECNGLGRSGTGAQEPLETWSALTPAGPGRQACPEGGQP